MMNFQSDAGGRLALLGSEGVGAGFERAWWRILGDATRHVNLLPLPTAEPGLVFLARLTLAEALLTKLGCQVQIQSAPDQAGEQVFEVMNDNAAILVSAEAPFSSSGGDLPGRAGLAGHFAHIIRAGGTIIAGATAAAGMGESLIEVTRPLPKEPADASVAESSGLGLLDRALVMPYFEQIPPAFLEALRHVFDSDILRIGIEENAALVIDAQGARPAGLGKVTLLRDNEVVWVGADGEEAPTGLITLNLHSHR